MLVSRRRSLRSFPGFRLFFNQLTEYRSRMAGKPTTTLFFPGRQFYLAEKIFARPRSMTEAATVDVKRHLRESILEQISTTTRNRRSCIYGYFAISLLERRIQPFLHHASDSSWLSSNLHGQCLGLTLFIPFPFPSYKTGSRCADSSSSVLPTPKPIPKWVLI